MSITATNDTHDATADIRGHFFKQLYPENRYTINISKAGYNGQQISFSASPLKEPDTIVRTVSLYIPPPPPPPVVKKSDTLTPVPLSFTTLVGVPEVNKIYEIGHFYFAYDKSDLNDTAKIVLDSLADYLSTQPNMRIQIRAHTDCRGGDAYNLKLSDARALSVMNYLKKKGIAERRLSSVGLGMREPKVPCPICEKCTEEQYYLNRVLEFKVLEL